MRFGPYKNSKKKRKEHYFLGLDKLEVVKSFKYVGVQLQQNLYKVELHSEGKISGTVGSQIRLGRSLGQNR